MLDEIEDEMIDTAKAISLVEELEEESLTTTINPKANEDLHLDEIEGISAPDYCLRWSHINAAMNLLQCTFPELGGFFKVQHGGDLTFPKETEAKWIQIIHTGGFHWVVAAYGFFNRSSVLIYDTGSLEINHRQWEQISFDDLFRSHVLDSVSCLMRANFSVARMASIVPESNLSDMHCETLLF